MDCEIVADVDHLRVKAGDRVNTRVVLSLDRSVRFRSIIASFEGKEQVELDVSRGDSDSDRKIRKTHRIADDVFLLAGVEPAGWFADALDSVRSLFGKGTAGTLDQGVHEFNVSWDIPASALPSFDGRNANIDYRLSIRVDRPLRRDDVFDLDFIVHPASLPLSRSVTVNYPNDDSGVIARSLSKALRATVTLEKDIYRVGETIAGEISIEVDEPIDIKALNVALLSEEHVQINVSSEKSQKRYGRFALASTIRCEDAWQDQFSFVVDAVPNSTVHGKYFKYDWYVELHIDVAWAIDTKICVPVQMHN